MTAHEKEMIIKLRRSGQGYKKIASILNLPQAAVKTFCRRHPIDVCTDSAERICPVCGVRLESIPHKKQKKFCSDKCRMKWWNSHPERVKHKLMTTWVCSYCGKEFQNRGSLKRVYCSRACYALARTKEVRQNG